MFAKWTTTEFSTYLQYKKFPEDGAMPKLVAEKRNRCQNIMEIKSPDVSPHASDDEGDDAPDDEGEIENVPDEEQ